jgi:hypothetical protein
MEIDRASLATLKAEGSMRIFAGVLIASSMFLVSLPTTSYAEDYLNVGGWYEGLYTKFKPSCALRALEITHDHFGPVDKKIGRNVLVFDFRTGEWDQIVYFPVIFTGEGYEWVKEKEWWSTFIEQEGGQDQADAVFGEYLDCLAASKREVGRLLIEPASSN